MIGGLCEITENLIGDEGELGGVVELEGSKCTFSLDTAPRALDRERM